MKVRKDSCVIMCALGMQGQSENVRIKLFLKMPMQLPKYTKKLCIVQFELCGM